jgi:hypothetical protein
VFAAYTASFAAIAYISTHTYLTLTNPKPYRRKTMTDQPTTTIGQPPATLDNLRQALDELLATRIACLGCAGDNYRAARAGTPDDQLPPVNLANVIVQGNGQCWKHVQFVDRPLAPGQMPSGLLIPGQA